jgi:thiamine biosynthesis lipoprotein
MQAAERRFRVMGCEAQVVVTCPDTVIADDPTATGWLDEAEAHLRHLEARWSRFLADSDMSRVNLANGKPVPTHPDTLTLVAVM